MKNFIAIILTVLVFPTSLLSSDWRDMSPSDFNKWHTQLESLIEIVSVNTSQENKNGYYWYFYGAIKIASYCIREKIVLQGQSHIKNAEECCEFLYQDDNYIKDRCKTILKKLQSGPLDDDNQIIALLSYMPSQTNKGSGINAADNITPLSE